MNLKVIDKDKVKIQIEEKDLDDLQLPSDASDMEDVLAREFILSLLNETYVRTGINFLDSKILVEIVAGASFSFYIIITRLSDKNTSDNNFAVKADEDMYLFELCHPENIFDVSAVVKNEKTLKTGSSKMYKYKNKFYLMINFPPETVSNDRFSELLSKLNEYSVKCRWSILNEAMLCEWGELMIKDPIKKLKI